MPSRALLQRRLRFDYVHTALFSDERDEPHSDRDLIDVAQFWALVNTVIDIQCSSSAPGTRAFYDLQDDLHDPTEDLLYRRHDYCNGRLCVEVVNRKYVPVLTTPKHPLTTMFSPKISLLPP